MYRRDSAVGIFIEYYPESKNIFPHFVDEYQFTFDRCRRNRRIYKSYCYYCFLVYSMRCCKYSDFKQEATLSMDVKNTKIEWILCPVCGNKTRVQIREDTELKNFPLFCPKCHKQTLINAKQLNITKAEVPDAKTQSR